MSLNLADDKSILVQVTAWCRQAQAIHWTNVDPALCRHMSSIGHNKLTGLGFIIPLQLALKVNCHPKVIYSEFMPPLTFISATIICITNERWTVISRVTKTQIMFYDAYSVLRHPPMYGLILRCHVVCNPDDSQNICLARGHSFNIGLH